MYLHFFDHPKVTERKRASNRKRLSSFAEQFAAHVEKPKAASPLRALTTWQDSDMLERVYTIVQSFKKPKHVVLVGIGGSSLGTEAIHAVLATPRSPQLHVLDTVAPHELDAILRRLAKVKKPTDIAVCVVSKSGATIETLANAEVLVGSLCEQFGKSFWRQVVVVGDPKSQLVASAEQKGAHTITLPAAVGGRYSVFTPVGLVPLALLGHDIESLLAGVEDTCSSVYTDIAYMNAAREYTHLTAAGVRHRTFFAFDTRLVRLGKWYRQLAAESLGKATTRTGTPNRYLFVPTVVTAVELHSVAQLYFANPPGVYTDFVTFDDDTIDFRLPAKPALAPTLAKHTHQDIAAAIYAGVVAAYQDSALPYRSTIFDAQLDYSLGLYMSSRMLEVIALAELLDVDAFIQPNVERYKQHTKRYLRAS